MRDLRRSTAGLGPYKWAIKRCCNPECKEPEHDLHIHHITPVAQDGESCCENYIVLCRYCHMNLGLHEQWREWQERLYQWKFMQELLCIGYTSDDYTHEEYLAILRSTEKAKGRT